MNPRNARPSGKQRGGIECRGTLTRSPAAPIVERMTTQIRTPAAQLRPLSDAIAEAGLPCRPKTVRCAMERGEIEGAKVRGRWYCTPEAIRRALLRPVGPGER